MSARRIEYSHRLTAARPALIGYGLVGCMLIFVRGISLAAELAPSDATAAGEQPAGATAADDKNLATEQAKLAQKFKDLERVLLRMAEVTQTNDPKRAAVLRQVFAKGKEKQVGLQFEDIVKLLENQQLYQANKGQVAVQQDLNRLLELLLTGDRDKQIPNERAEIKKFIERINKVIREEQGVQGETEGQGDPAELAKRQEAIAKKTQELEQELKKFDDRNKPAGEGTDTEGKQGSDQKGADQKVTDKKDASKKDGGQKQGSESKPGDGNEREDKPTDGQPADEKGADKKQSDKSGSDKSGSDKSGSDKSGSDNKADEEKADTKDEAADKKQDKKQGNADKKAADKQADNKKSDDKKSADKESDDKKGDEKNSDEKSNSKPSDSDHQPPDSQSKKSSSKGSKSQSQGEQQQQAEGSDAEGSDSDSDQQQNQQQNKDESPARKRIREAQERMQEAKRRLEQAKRRGAADEQQKAIDALQLAKAELEEILRQLREEEIERTLAMLEGRFRKMLQMQIEVYEGTVRLDRVPEDERDRDIEIESAKLSRREAEITAEADKALNLLREEGSSAAFPEAVEQMREDMEGVTGRLARANVGQLTQGVEQDIVKALEEMIASLQKAQKEAQKRKGGGGGGGGGDQDQDLVDQIAELKMIRALQMRINTRTQRYTRMLEEGAEQADQPDLVEAIRKLSEREERVYKTTRDISLGRNQ